MPNSCLSFIEQGKPHTQEGVIVFGDAWNMRHPFTGGGMTVALADVVLLAPMLAASQTSRSGKRSRTFSIGGTDYYR